MENTTLSRQVPSERDTVQGTAGRPHQKRVAGLPHVVPATPLRKVGGRNHVSLGAAAVTVCKYRRGADRCTEFGQHCLGQRLESNKPPLENGWAGSFRGHPLILPSASCHDGFMTSTTDFETAAHSFLDLVAEVKVSQWGEPALGVWDVRSLVGHTARAILVVEQYLLADPAPAVTAPDAEGYYVEVFSSYTDNDAIAARGVEAGKALNENSGAEFEATLGRALELIAQNGPDRIVAIGPIGIPLGEYLRTRVFELVVHSMDIAKATNQPHGIPPEVVANVADLAARVAVRKGSGEDILFALTGRRPLPPRYSIL